MNEQTKTLNTGSAQPGLLEPPSSLKLATQKVVPISTTTSNAGQLELDTSRSDTSRPKLQGILIKTKGANSQRKDRLGAQIDRTNKKHRITFRDFVVGGCLVDVNEIESYKEYNRFDSEEKSGCSCILL